MKAEIKSYYNIHERYIEELYLLQTELLKLQKYISDNKLRLAILYEGRDTAGKGSAINRFTQFLNPQSYRVVALGKPTKRERGQWYFQRYVKQLPNPGEIVFFDRSWYNRAVVEPVMGFCSPEQYRQFMNTVNNLEDMLVNDGIKIIKFWFSIGIDEQKNRIEARLKSPLQQWKVSPVDLAAQAKWESFSDYKEKMYQVTSTVNCPWITVRGNTREESRIQTMRYVLNQFDYPDKSEDILPFDPFQIGVWSDFYK